MLLLNCSKLYQFLTSLKHQNVLELMLLLNFLNILLRLESLQWKFIKQLISISKLQIISQKLWCLMHLLSLLWNMKTLDLKYKWFVIFVHNIGILMCNKEVLNILPYFNKVNKFKRKCYHKILYLLKNNNKLIHCWKSLLKNQALQNCNHNQLQLNLQLIKAQLNHSHRHLYLKLFTVLQAILYRLTHVSKKLLKDCLQISLIFLIFQEKLTWNHIGKKPLLKRHLLMTVRLNKKFKMVSWK